MSDEKYNIIFKGQLAKGADLAATKANLAKIFSIDARKVEALFSGKEITLKKSVDIDTAGKFRIALKKAGAIIEVQEIINKPVIKAVKPMGKAVFKIADEPPPLPTAQVDTIEAKPAEAASSPGLSPEVASEATPELNGSDKMGLVPQKLAPQNLAPQNEITTEKPPVESKPAGKAVFNIDGESSALPLPTASVDELDEADADAAELISKVKKDAEEDLGESIRYEPPVIKSSSSELSSALPLAEVVEEGAVGGDADLPESQKQVVLDKPDTIPDFGVLPVGSDVLEEGERQEVEAVDVDVSSLDLKELGGLLVEVDEIPIAEPVDIKNADFDLANVGEDLLTEQDKHEVQALTLNLDHFTLADVGSDVGGGGASKDEAVPTIDVSHLSLAEHDENAS